MRPIVNEQVHYVALGSANGVYPSVCRAAIITEVGLAGTVGLCVLNPTGMFFHSLAERGGVPAHDGLPTPDAAGVVGATCHSGERVYPGGTWHRAEAVAE